MADQILTQELLHQNFEYKNGVLFRKIQTSNFIKKGDIAGSLTKNGYLVASILGKRRLVHRLIFMMFYGYMPEQVDHIDGNRANNKIENLRAATPQTNGFNQKIRARNTSGVKGVSYRKDINKWRAYCTINYKQVTLGCFDDIQSAKKVIESFRNVHQGEFARHQ